MATKAPTVLEKHVVDRHHVRVREPRHRLRLFDESRLLGRIVEAAALAMQRLERHPSIELWVVGGVDDAHPTCAELTHDLIPPDRRSRRGGPRAGALAARRWSRWRPAPSNSTRGAGTRASALHATPRLRRRQGEELCFARPSNEACRVSTLAFPASPDGSSWSRCWPVRLSSRRTSLAYLRLRRAPPVRHREAAGAAAALWLASLRVHVAAALASLPALPRVLTTRALQTASGLASLARAPERHARPLRARALGGRARVPCEGGRDRDRGLPPLRGDRRRSHGPRDPRRSSRRPRVPSTRDAACDRPDERCRRIARDAPRLRFRGCRSRPRVRHRAVGPRSRERRRRRARLGALRPLCPFGSSTRRKDSP